MKRKRFTREDWLDFALARLAENGPETLKVTTICEAAGRTIGSFYHHFDDQAQFFDALLGHWRKTNTEEVIAAVEAIPDADRQAERLNTVAMTMNQAVEVGMRQFAFQNKQAARAVAEIDEIRISYLAQSYVRRLALAEADARLLAELEYAAFVGTQIVWRGGSLGHGQQLSGLFQRLVASRYGR